MSLVFFYNTHSTTIGLYVKVPRQRCKQTAT